MNDVKRAICAQIYEGGAPESVDEALGRIGGGGSRKSVAATADWMYVTACVTMLRTDDGTFPPEIANALRSLGVPARGGTAKTRSTAVKKPRALSGYMRYAKSVRAEVVGSTEEWLDDIDTLREDAENAGKEFKVSLALVTKEIGKRWRELAPEEKEPFNRAYEEERDRLAQEHEGGKA